MKILSIHKIPCYVALLFLSLSGLQALGQDKTLHLHITPGNVKNKIASGIYGQFLEHILGSVNGGLWGELVMNRSFEALTPRPKNPAGATSPVNIIPGWETIGSVIATVDTIGPLNGTKSLRLVSTEAGAGISQKALNVKTGDALHGSLWLKSMVPGKIMIKLMSGKGTLAKQIINYPATGWKEFKLALIPAASTDSAVLQITGFGKIDIRVDQVSLMANSSRATGGFRPDLLKAVAALKPASIRFPGGDFVNGYHWENGTGPQYKRAGKGGIDPLAMGIDEFMLLCRKVGAEPAICVPMGKRDLSETAQYIKEAENELEYCNGSATSKWGRLRAANGHPNPYHVKYWEVDNEVYLQGMNPEKYQLAFNEFADALRQKDPSIKIIGSGGGGTNLSVDKGWSIKMLRGDLSHWDYISLHQYENYSRGNAPVDSAKFRTGIIDFEHYYAALRDSIKKSNRKDLKVYESEWNYMSVDWRTGLYAGGVLNCFERNADLVTMACPALFLRSVTAKGWDNALINFSNSSWYPAPNYVIMKLYRDHFEPYGIGTTGDAGPLNIVSTKSNNGKTIVVKIVNADKVSENAEFTIDGKIVYDNASVKWVAEQLDTKNTLQNPAAISIHTNKVTISKNTFRVNMRPYSVAVIKVSKQ